MVQQGSEPASSSSPGAASDYDYDYDAVEDSLIHSDTVEVLLGEGGGGVEEEVENVSGGASVDGRSESLVIVENNNADEQFWPHLNATWSADGSDAFFPQPRTEEEAVAQGWTRISSCGDSDTRFPGNRYLQSLNDDDLDDFVLIFDEAGFIAGVQSLVPLDVVEGDDKYDFDVVPFYQKDQIRGREVKQKIEIFCCFFSISIFFHKVYFVTAYLVDPGLICAGGRSERQFESQGSGYALYLQSGPSVDNRVSVPVTLEGAESDIGWSRKACVPNTGLHYFPFTYDEALRIPDGCSTLTPFSVTYGQGGRLNGFAFTHVGALTGSR